MLGLKLLLIGLEIFRFEIVICSSWSCANEINIGRSWSMHIYREIQILWLANARNVRCVLAKRLWDANCKGPVGAAICKLSKGYSYIYVRIGIILVVCSIIGICAYHYLYSNSNKINHDKYSKILFFLNQVF